MGEVSASERQKAKICCLVMIYGSGTGLLARQMEVNHSEAIRFKSEFFRRCPEVAQWMQHEFQQAQLEGCVTVPSGRQRDLPDLLDPNKREDARRLVINTIVQGTAADLMK